MCVSIVEEIVVEDYFRKSVEFRTWLSEEVSELDTHTLRPAADVVLYIMLIVLLCCVVYRERSFSATSRRKSLARCSKTL